MFDLKVLTGRNSFKMFFFVFVYMSLNTTSFFFISLKIFDLHIVYMYFWEYFVDRLKEKTNALPKTSL